MCYGYRDAATMESKMRRFWILLMALPLLAACVSLADLRAEREAQLGSFIGQAEADLVRAFGVPSRQFESDGRRFLAYIERRVDFVPGYMPFSPYRYGFGYGPGLPPQAIERSCETTFEIVAGKVFGYSFRGNACS